MVYRLRYLGCLSIGVLLLASGLTPGASAATITVTGQDDASVDRSTIQAAIDSARPGDTIQLVGNFQLDGEQILLNKNHLTILGLEVDDDGDGRVNEDWLDSVDNDGDGTIDEDGWDTVLKGLDSDNNGIPDFDQDFSRGFNRGFTVKGLTETFRQITIRGIEFQNHDRAITIAPDWDSTSTACADYFSTGGLVAGMSIENNRFENNTRALQVIGAARQLQISANVFTNNGSPGNGIGIFVQGFGTGCLDPDGNPAPFFIGNTSNSRLVGNTSINDNGWASIFASENVELVNNRIRNASFGAALIWGTQNVIRDNQFEQTFFPGILDLVERSSFSSNEITDALAGALLSSPSPGSSVSNNQFKNSAFWAIDVDFFAEGFSIVNNEFQNSAFTDVYLWETSTNNKVIATDFTTSVIDLGQDNRLLGTLAMINNPGVTDDVRAMLEAMRSGLGAETQ